MILIANTMVTGDGKSVLRDHALLIQNGKIIEVAPAEQLKNNFPDEEVKDYGNATILPGLIDMHVHLGYWYSKPDGYEYNQHLIAYLTQYNALRAMFGGVTTVRSVSDPHMVCQKLVQAKEKGFVRAPRIFNCDRGICATGGHGWMLEDGCAQVDGADNIRSEIRKQLRDGAHWIKMMDSDRSNVSEYRQEELDAAADECHRSNRKICVHAGTQPSIQMCIDAGFDTIEHGTFMTVEQALQMKEKGLAWVPTIIAYTYIYDEMVKKLAANQTESSNVVDAGLLHDFEYFRAAAAAYKENFKKLYDTGVTVLAGTDMVMDGAPAAPVARELQYMVEYGITPVEAIATATGNSARVLGMQGQIGELTQGAVADLLVVEGDASADICALNRVKEVYQDGAAIHRAI